MVLSVPTNTYNYLQNARKGVVVRYLFWITAKNRSTGALEQIGIWNDAIAKTLPVRRPDTGAVVNRVFQPGAGQISMPEIPQTMSLEIATLTVTFGRLTPAIVNAVKVYNPRRQSFQIYMALFDPDTRKIIDPAICIWDGIVNKTPIKRDKVGGTGTVQIVTADHAAMLEQTNAIKMSAAFFEERGDHAGRHNATIWRVRIPWGQAAITYDRKPKPKERFYRS